MKRPFLAFIICEAAYIATVRVLVFTYTGSEVHKELYWSGLRLISAILLLFIFRQVNRSKEQGPKSILLTAFIAGTMLIVPVLVGDLRLKNTEPYVFAVTSILVGWREELAYRGILQNALQSKLGITASLLISNILFVLYHCGVQPFTVSNVMQLFLVGIILGTTYYATRSILLVVTLHALYDAIWCFTPILNTPLSMTSGLSILTLTLLALIATHRRGPSAQMA